MPSSSSGGNDSDNEPSTSSAPRRSSRPRKVPEKLLSPVKKIVPKKAAVTPKNAPEEDSPGEKEEEEIKWPPPDIRKSRQAIKAETKLTEEFLKRNPDLFNNNFPRVTFSYACRKPFLQLTSENDLFASKEANGEFTEACEKTCIICAKENDEEGNEELITCQGRISGEIREGHRAPAFSANYYQCRSKMHEKCAMKYNAGDFQFQYAARHECQAQLLCPLHCCNSCNLNHYKQSAYVADLIECSLCFRSFHLATCYPVGGRDLNVVMEIDGKQVTFEMLICPKHLKLPEVLGAKKHEIAHLEHCFSKNCNHEGDPLIKCTSCIRAFHKGCREVEMIDGLPVPDDQCEVCICRDEIPLTAPVIVKWNQNKFYLAETVDWFAYPTHFRKNPNFEKLGYTAVRWFYPGEKKQDYSIVPVADLVELVEAYLPLAPHGNANLWKEKLEKHGDNGLNRCPNVYKRVFKDARTSRHLVPFNKYRVIPEDEHCDCKGPNRCSTTDCADVLDGRECPPSCSKKEGGCNNRKVSESKLCPKMKLTETKQKGYGVIAKEKIHKGEFLAEYVGEIIDRNETNRRKSVVEITRDFQANHYMMEISNGMTIDAARVGNIARYINHCCEPNAACFMTDICVRRDKHNSYYDARVYLKAIKDIKKGQEITFSYRMGDGLNLPECYCDAENCTGSMSVQKMVKEPKKEVDSRKKLHKKKKAIKRKSDSSEIEKSSSPADEDAPLAKRIRSKSAAAPSTRRSVLLKIEQNEVKRELEEQDEQEDDDQPSTSTAPPSSMKSKLRSEKIKIEAREEEMENASPSGESRRRSPRIVPKEPNAQ